MGLGSVVKSIKKSTGLSSLEDRLGLDVFSGGPQKTFERAMGSLSPDVPDMPESVKEKPIDPEKVQVEQAKREADAEDARRRAAARRMAAMEGKYSGAAAIAGGVLGGTTGTGTLSGL